MIAQLSRIWVLLKMQFSLQFRVRCYVDTMDGLIMTSQNKAFKHLHVEVLIFKLVRS